MKLAGTVTLSWSVVLAGSLLLAGTAAGQNSPRVGMLEQAGWNAIRSGDFKAASEAFGEAAKLDPKNAMLWLGTGTAEFLLRHDDLAKSHLERALELEPKVTRARAQLAQVIKRS